MQLSLHNDKEIYNITAIRSLPDWLSDRRRRRLLKRDKELARQITIIHEFEMPNLSTCVATSHDHKHLFALGTYKPQVKCFELENMSEKFTRGVDSLPHKIEFIESDYSKFWLLEDNRWLDFHTRQGHYFKTRIPKPCRDMNYFPLTNELYVAGASDEIYRFNHTRGGFMPSLKSPGGTELTAITSSVSNGIILCGTVDGKIDAWDPRVHKCRATLDVVRSTPEVFSNCQSTPEVTCIHFKDTFNFGVGLSSGHILLFDIRKRTPRLVKDHHYRFPIIDFAFHHEPRDPKVISIDKKCVKIWDDKDDAPTWASFEPGVALNGLYLWERSGLFHLANEDTKIISYFVPELGLAPRWCNKIYGLLEECDEQAHTVFDDQKFVSRENLERWGFEKLIGTEHLRAYMHGFFMKTSLYEKLRKLAGPADKEQELEMRVQEYLRKKQEELSISTTDAVVNKDLTTDVDDNRFKSLFTDPEFAIDPASEEASKTQRLKRMKEKKEKKRLKAREKATRSNKILLDDM